MSPSPAADPEVADGWFTSSSGRLDHRGNRRSVPGRPQAGAEMARPVPRRGRARTVGSVIAAAAFTEPNTATSSPARDPVTEEAALGRRTHRARGRSRTVDGATHPAPGRPCSPRSRRPRTQGRGHGYDNECSVTRRGGFRFVHSALDDRNRLAYSGILDEEQAITAVGFWHRAIA